MAESVVRRIGTLSSWLLGQELSTKRESEKERHRKRKGCGPWRGHGCKHSAAHQHSEQLTPRSQHVKTSWTRTLLADGANVLAMQVGLCAGICLSSVELTDMDVPDVSVWKIVVSLVGKLPREQ